MKEKRNICEEKRMKYVYIDGGSYGFTLKKLQEMVSQWFIVVSGVLDNISKVHQNLITENVKISRWPPSVFFLH